jgi:hypothetical protein
VGAGQGQAGYVSIAGKKKGTGGPSTHLMSRVGLARSRSKSAAGASTGAGTMLARAAYGATSSAPTAAATCCVAWLPRPSWTPHNLPRPPRGHAAPARRGTRSAQCSGPRHGLPMCDTLGAPDQGPHGSSWVSAASEGPGGGGGGLAACAPCRCRRQTAQTRRARTGPATPAQTDERTTGPRQRSAQDKVESSVSIAGAAAPRAPSAGTWSSTAGGLGCRAARHPCHRCRRRRRRRPRRLARTTHHVS